MSGSVTFFGPAELWRVTNFSNVRTVGNIHELDPIPGIVDPLTPATAAVNSSIYLLYDFGGPGSQNQGVELPPGQGNAYTETSGSTSTSTLTKEFDLSVGVGIGGDDGVYSLDISTTVFWLTQTQSVSTGITNGLSFALGGLTTNRMCYVVYGVGGTQASDIADTIGVWAYTPTLLDGNYVCPIPT